MEHFSPIPIDILLSATRNGQDFLLPLPSAFISDPALRKVVQGMPPITIRGICEKYNLKFPKGSLAMMNVIDKYNDTLSNAIQKAKVNHDR